MNFQLSEDLSILRSTVSEFSRDQKGTDSAQLWRALAGQLGLFSLVEEAGFAGSVIALSVIFEEIGTALLPVSLRDTLAVAPLLLRSGGAAGAACLDKLASGDAVAAFAWRETRAADVARAADLSIAAQSDGFVLAGTKIALEAEPIPTHALVTGRLEGETAVALVDLDMPGIRLRPYRSIDGRTVVDVAFDHCRIASDALLASGEEAERALRMATSRSMVCLCAEAIGLMRAMLDHTVDHLRTRHQFGHPLADFQVLQHRIADMLAHLELATSASLRATLSMEKDEQRDRAVGAAMVVVADALKFIGENAVQLHGGMGMSEESPVGGYFKRALVLTGHFGTRDGNLRRLANEKPVTPVAACE